MLEFEEIIEYIEGDRPIHSYTRDLFYDYITIFGLTIQVGHQIQSSRRLPVSYLRIYA